MKKIEEALENFESTLQRQQKRFTKPTLSNLRPTHWDLIDTMKNHDELMAIEADKNIGICILRRGTYNTRGVDEHLGDTSVYQKLTKRQAFQKQRILHLKTSIFASKWSDEGAISPAETHFILQSLRDYPDKMARFRMSLKAHKTPWKMRPIVCCAGTFINNLSRWLDHWLQKLKPFVKTYLKNSTSLLDMLERLGQLPPNAWLFTADANSMYTNIDTDHAIEVIGMWLDSLKDQLPPDFPLEAVKEAMELVMKNNIFEWGDLYFLQLLGTAMGTSAACMWATIYFAVHENGKLIPTYESNLLLFVRYIDDIFGIWIDTAESPNAWNNFIADTNDFGILTWDFEQVGSSVNFLDLTITIEGTKVTTKTYQKALNLYQYIMPSSAHPPGMMRGVISGLLKTYRRQNTYRSDYNKIAIETFKRHVARGWNRATMKEYILTADAKLTEGLTTKPPTSLPTSLPSLPSPNPTAEPELTNHERIFLHWEYHPNDIPRKNVRTIYNNTCKELFEDALGIKQTTIAYSRPKNLKDVLTKAKLYQAPGREASKFYSGELSER